MHSLHFREKNCNSVIAFFFLFTCTNVLPTCTFLLHDNTKFLYSYHFSRDLQILEALTTKKCQEEFSQESLETLGDSFLKYVTTQHLFKKHKLYHEGMLTKMKKNLISNAALCQLACNKYLVVCMILHLTCFFFLLIDP
ncbi:hypothetical protein PR202_ga12572 [Eleusine coracana subsp. coracana]|uniref:RNase III domain-containing protein n=1 Tax=Eleusine coracana subsp. coracana TaxID=191504 RepID=A0AAV5CCH6_ELECO|nr:hypothetical protein PR202_ga12572 [Eleusine coracana subsp. coracana]